MAWWRIGALVHRLRGAATVRARTSTPPEVDAMVRSFADRSNDGTPRRAGARVTIGRAATVARGRAPWWVWWAAVSLVASAGCVTAQGSALPTSLTVPVIVPALSADDGPLVVAVERAARQGAEMVRDEFSFNASLLGVTLEVPIVAASGSDAVVGAARALLDEHPDTVAIVGGFGGTAETVALATWAAGVGVPFLNVGSEADVLRNDACQATTFHVVPSAAMYVDALAGWYVRSGYRRWYLIHGEDDEGTALEDRVTWSLRERHFGARVVGRATSDATPASVARGIRRSNADLVVLLVDAETQLDWLGDLEAEGIDVVVAGVPTYRTQTRAFLFASRDAAPTLGTDHRAQAFEATLDAYGAREINARYLARFGEPMDVPAWAAYQGVKIAYEAVFFQATTAWPQLLSYLASQDSVFDLWKGIGTSFRPWDRQLRQSMYLVKISTIESQAFRLALLVGQLPAIYLPGTDPVERLDQIGDLDDRSTCTQ